MNLLRRLGWDELEVTADDAKRVLVLVVVCLLSALWVVDWSRAPYEELQVGDVAPRTVKANQSFQYIDEADRTERATAARSSALPVYVVEAGLESRISQRVRIAFEQGRGALEPAAPVDGEAPEGGEEAAAPELVLADVASAFRTNVGVHVPDADVASLAVAGFPREAEDLAVKLITRAMAGYVVDDRASLPADAQTIRLVERREGARPGDELELSSHDAFRTVREAREQVRLELLEAGVDGGWGAAIGSLVRAAVRPNTAFDPIETRARADMAASQVPVATLTVKRGTTLFRQGDVLTAGDIVRYRALQSGGHDHGIAVEVAAVAFFLLMLFVSLYHFGVTYLREFPHALRDVGAAGALIVLTALTSRLAVGAAPGVATFVGMEADPTAVWFIVPVAGAAMLVRLLLGVGWTVVFSVAAAAVCGLIMDLSALYVVFVLLSSFAAAGAVDHTRERMSVLRAGVFTGVVNAAAVLLIHFVQLFLGDNEVSLATTMRPFWWMAFSLTGGVLSSFVVLGLMPVFEVMGFVTDYRLMELANLNHPLLRQLMIRAPGTYHHSIVVGSLAEAGCEAIGANALQARVAAYFHDIGKGMRPQFFVENQREGVNRHDQLDPQTSASIIISHVVDGGRLAREHKLPKPIIDNIHMHHGTGILQYFYMKARELADDSSSVSESEFRYPGPKPDTREAGVIMLADKVEAATRTIRSPNEANIRAMIGQIISSVIADGQFEHCPLTLQEIHTVSNTFVRVLVGIYHHRIEYPTTRGISLAGEEGDTSVGTITMELPAPEPPRGPAVPQAPVQPPPPPE